MIILRQKIFGGNRENKAKRKAWEEQQGLETYQKKIANNGTNEAQWNNPVNPKLMERREFLKEGSKEAKAELRAIHRNKFNYNDIRNNIPKKLYEKHTDYSPILGWRVDDVSARVEGGEDAYQRIMEKRSGDRKRFNTQSRGVNKHGVRTKPLPKPSVPSASTIKGGTKGGSILGGIIGKVGKGLRKIARK